MTNEPYVIAIVALLPLTAVMLVVQVNPYHALVMRGILGAIAALVYALLGAADVALTEALVGTMLSITLYAVAVRSSMTVRIGMLGVASETSPVVDSARGSVADKSTAHKFVIDERVTDELVVDQSVADKLQSGLQVALRKHHLSIELVGYPSVQALEQAIAAKEVHAICVTSPTERLHLQVRVQHLYNILRELSDSIALSYIAPDAPIVKHDVTLAP